MPCVDLPWRVTASLRRPDRNDLCEAPANRCLRLGNSCLCNVNLRPRGNRRHDSRPGGIKHDCFRSLPLRMNANPGRLGSGRDSCCRWPRKQGIRGEQQREQYAANPQEVRPQRHSSVLRSARTIRSAGTPAHDDLTSGPATRIDSIKAMSGRNTCARSRRPVIPEGGLIVNITATAAPAVISRARRPDAKAIRLKADRRSRVCASAGRNLQRTAQATRNSRGAFRPGPNRPSRDRRN